MTGFFFSRRLQNKCLEVLVRICNLETAATRSVAEIHDTLVFCFHCLPDETLFQV